MHTILPMLVAVGVVIAGYVWAAPVAAQTPVCPPDDVWHAPACGHEHGDAPPPWIADAGYNAGFDDHGGFHGNTSAQENTTKHRSMKGMLATFGAQQVYIRVHFASNVLERMSRYHSYEVFIRDAVGAVSHYQGWMNSGDPSGGGTGRRSRAVADNGVRPIVLVTDQASLQLGRECEVWYTVTSAWGPDLGWTICGSTSMYYTQENQYPEYEIPLCDYGYRAPTCKGSDRELEFSLYVTGSTYAASRGNLVPKNVHFYATQFGEGVAGLSDPRCQQGATTEKFGMAYQNICLEQYVADSLRAIENGIPGGNRFRKNYDVTGVTYPN
jgi:hypothetical protein